MMKKVCFALALCLQSLGAAETMIFSGIECIHTQGKILAPEEQIKSHAVRVSDIIEYKPEGVENWIKLDYDEISRSGGKHFTGHYKETVVRMIITPEGFIIVRITINKPYFSEMYYFLVNRKCTDQRKLSFGKTAYEVN